MKTKLNKDSRNLLIALLLGDGTISNNNVFKLLYGESILPPAFILGQITNHI